jgi:hypothetical protein
VLAGDGPGGGPVPDSYRPTVLAGDSQDRFAAPPPGSGAAGDAGLPPLQPLGPGAPGGQANGNGNGKGKRARHGGGGAAWPSARPRRRRRPWAGVVSTLITLAIIGGVGGYVYLQNHKALKVTAATVSIANPDQIGCNSTVDVVGTIFTNGNGGPITFQWTKDGENQPVGTVTAASGEQQVRVDLRWALHGKGTHHGTAILAVFTPNVVSQQSATFTYKCGS